MSLLKNLIIVVVLFLIICKPEFVFIPFGVNRFFGVLGLFVFLQMRRQSIKLLIAQELHLEKL